MASAFVISTHFCITDLIVFFCLFILFFCARIKAEARKVLFWFLNLGKIIADEADHAGSGVLVGCRIGFGRDDYFLFCIHLTTEQ